MHPVRVRALMFSIPLGPEEQRSHLEPGSDLIPSATPSSLVIHISHMPGLWRKHTNPWVQQQKANLGLLRFLVKQTLSASHSTELQLPTNKGMSMAVSTERDEGRTICYPNVQRNQLLQPSRKS